MTQIAFAEIVFQYLFIYLIEVGFLMAMSSLFMEKNIDLKRLFPSMLVLGTMGQIVLNIGSGGVINRLFYLIFIVAYMSIKNQYGVKDIYKYGVSIMISTFVMLLCEAIGFIPFLFIFGDKMQVLSEDVFILIALSIPTRVFEYIVLYVFYLRKVGANEKVIT